ncbi:MAG: hypothetical protein QW503_07245 [Sulfolobales archaeon]
MIKCPYCGYEGDEKIFKLLREPWKYGYYTAKRFECPRCNKKFRYYEGVSPSGRHVEFYIPKPKTESRYVRKAEGIASHDSVVKMLKEIGEVLDFHVTVEEEATDKTYRYDCIWRDAPDHGPLKVFEVEFKSDVDKALVRLAHAYDLWHSELYLIVADEKDLKRARKLVEPRLSGAFTKIKNKLTILSPTTLARIHECLCEEGLDEVVRRLSRR